MPPKNRCAITCFNRSKNHSKNRAIDLVSELVYSPIIFKWYAVATLTKGVKDMALKGIATARKLCGMTQRDLARVLGVTKLTVSRWERGVVTPRTNMLLDIADALSCGLEPSDNGSDFELRRG